MLTDKVRDYVRSSLWVLPALMALVALGLAQAVIATDQAIGGPDLIFAFPGDGDTARSVLSTIAAAMISFTGIVFTLTIVALQLASQQFSPRILRTFFEDRSSQIALGTFVATFIYALMALRQVGAETNPVPRLTVSVSLLLVGASTIAFVAYLDHMAKSIRISYIIVQIGDETRALLDRWLPAEHVETTFDRDGDAAFVRASRPGVMNEIHIVHLVKLAKQRSLRIAILPSVGDFVPEGGKVAAVYGAEAERSIEDIRTLIDLGKERSMEQDVAFGLRQLVDIAVKAISPAINDPTTAIQALDQIHDVLKRLASRPLPERRVYDGVLSVHPPTWHGLVNLGLNEIRHFGTGYIQVARRARALLLDLLQHAPEDRHPILHQELELLEASIERGFHEAPDKALALEKDEQGIG